MSMIKLFFDLETTGLNPKLHSVHQLSGIIEVEGEVAETFDYKIRPHPKAKYEPVALSTCRVTEEQLKSYPEMKTVHRQFTDKLCLYVDKYNPKDNIHLIGFNNRYFDDNFLRAWFLQCSDEFINARFWGDTIDVLVLASQYLLERRSNMPSFKLLRVAKELGLEVDKTKLHDASYDVYLTRQIYRVVTGLEFEI